MFLSTGVYSMGYTTEFKGQLKFDRPLAPAHVAYLRAFSGSRRMKRRVATTAKLADPVRKATSLGVGLEGGYYVGTDNATVVDANTPPTGQPGLYCKWTVTEDGQFLEWNGQEKFSNYVQWLGCLLSSFLIPWGYSATGVLVYQGEDKEDYGTLTVINNIMVRKVIEKDDRITTVNVLEISDVETMSVSQLVSFNYEGDNDDEDDGLRSAEKLFKALALENGAADDELASLVEDGEYLYGNYRLCLIRSA